MILPCVTGGSGKIDLLWTNPTPTADFGAQTIPVSVSSYDYILIIGKRSKSVVLPDYTGRLGIRSLYKVANNLNQENLMISISDDNNTSYRRSLTLTTNGITFSAGSTSWVIPVYIYGIKSDTVIG